MPAESVLDALDGTGHGAEDLGAGFGGPRVEAGLERLGGALDFGLAAALDEDACGAGEGWESEFAAMDEFRLGERDEVVGGGGPDGVVLGLAGLEYDQAALGTTVNAGTLLMNGSLGAGAVTVNSTGTLGGNGIIGGAVTVNSGGFLAPGASIGTLTVANLLDFRGTYLWEYDATASDLVETTTLTFGAGPYELDVTWLGPGMAAQGDYPRFICTGADPVLPAWSVVAPLPAMVWLDADGNRVMLTLALVPEPAALGLLLLGLPLVLRRRK